MKTATLIATLACVALALAELAQVSTQAQGEEQSWGPSTKSGELYEDATWGPEGSPYTIRDGFFVMEGAVLTIGNATILCESYTCLSVRGSLIMRDSFIGKRTVSRFTDRQGTVAIQHSSNAIASSIELHNVTIRSVSAAVGMQCCHSGQKTLITGSVIDDVGTGLAGYTGDYGQNTLIENSTIMYSGTGADSADRRFVNVLFYRNTLGSDSGRASFVGCRFMENEVGFKFNTDASLRDILFEGNKVAIEGHWNLMGSMAQVTFYQNDLAVRSSTGWTSNYWSELNFINNSINIEYTSSTISHLNGAYWGQCADHVTIRDSIVRTVGNGHVTVGSIAHAPNCHATFPCQHVSGCCSSTLILTDCPTQDPGTNASHPEQSWGQADWGKPEFDHCVQPFSWEELLALHRTNNASMGGLGKLFEVDGYETWQCVRGHHCALEPVDPWFCWVYHETDKIFTAWGPNSLLKLVRLDYLS
jgi:hypothetical protein